MIKGVKKNVYVKVISPNFDMRYIHSEKEIKETIDKIVRYSDPNPNKETIFVWPEGIFAGIYFKDLKKYSNTFSKSFSKKHLLIFGINTEDPSSNFFYNSLIVSNNSLDVLYKYNKNFGVNNGQ